MKNTKEGELLTSKDICEIVEFQRSLDQLPYLLEKYYIMKAGYFALRNTAMGVGVAATIIVLGFIAYLRSHDLLISIALIVFGVLIGFMLAWEISRNKGD
jgi:hypothetical protein